MITTDIVIVGGGIIGLSIARNLTTGIRISKITLIEKEAYGSMSRQRQK